MSHWTDIVVMHDRSSLLDALAEDADRVFAPNVAQAAPQSCSRNSPSVTRRRVSGV